MSNPQEKSYDWKDCDERLRALGFRSFRAWSHHYGFSDKTTWALRHGLITWGIGPKVRAILDQALKDGLVVETHQAA